MTTKNNEQGSTMLETILYICVLIALGTTIARGVARVFHRYNLGRASQQVVDLKKTILMFTAADEDYGKVSTSEINKALPLDMKNWRHALGGEIEIGCAKDYDRANEEAVANKFMYFITFKDLDKGSCTEILSQGQFFSAGSEVDTLIVNERYWQYEYSLFTFASTPGTINRLTQQHMQLQEAFTACSNKKDNTITWIFS